MKNETQNRIQLFNNSNSGLPLFRSSFYIRSFTPYNFWTAKQDIKNGKIQIVETGEKPLKFKQKQNLAKSYDFVIYLSGCNVATDITNGTKYYNKAMIEQLENKYGSGWWIKFQTQIDSIDNIK